VEAIDAAIEVAAASNASPDRSDPVLPNCDTSVWRSAVFKKDDSPFGFQDSLGLIEGLRGIRDRTESPCEDDGVDAACVEWKRYEVISDRSRGISCIGEATNLQ